MKPTFSHQQLLIHVRIVSDVYRRLSHECVTYNLMHLWKQITIMQTFPDICNLLEYKQAAVSDIADYVVHMARESIFHVCNGRLQW